jgi:threonine aldolase
MIDLRSDTVTQPTPEMREAMAKAAVGDDVYGEDPTINKLQEMAADLVGQEAGLLVPSGTMGNLAAVLAHCQRGDEVILGNKAHTFLYEAGGVSALGGVHSCQLPNGPDGTLALDEIDGAIRSDNPHHPITRLVTLENTHNRCGGVALTADYTQAVADLAHQNGIKLHIDGARIFNAAVVQGIRAKDLTGAADSVTFCLSKGLCAPVGSVLCGSKDFVARALRVRKQLGGGMRQAGILAAAGIVALEKMIDRLAEDHARAQRLAADLAELPGMVLDAGTPFTNMVFFELSPDTRLDTRQLVNGLKERGVAIGAAGARRFRLVTHYWINDQAVETTVAAFGDVLQTARML